MMETLAWVLAGWLVLSCVVGLAVGRFIDYIDDMFDVFIDYELMEELEIMSTAELQQLLDSQQLGMAERLAVMDELHKRKGNPQRPTDSQFECFGCGS